MYDPSKLAVERALARAHLALWQAASEAETWRDQGYADDLYQLAEEVGRVNVSLLKSERKKKT